MADIRHDEGTMQEIRDAVATGKEVITHTDPIAVPGWSGAGYVVFDPVKGDGAWRIGGGTNGTWFWALLGAFFTGLLDGLLKKYRSPDSMFGPYGEIKFSKMANFSSRALSLLGFSYAVFSTVSDDGLSTGEKVTTIGVNTIAAIAILKSVAAIMASSLVFPLSIFAAIFVVVAITLFSLWLIDVITALRGVRYRQIFQV